MDAKLHDHVKFTPLLEVDNLCVAFSQYQRGLRRSELQVLHNLSLHLHAGEVLAVVGASGSGKSLLAHAILGLLPRNAVSSGSMRFDGEALTPALQETLRGKEMALIPQSVGYLDPLMHIGAQVRGVKGKKKERRQQHAFARYGLNEKVGRMYPHQLSGGMARRTLVSAAVISDARVIIADEPTPGLDAATARETLRDLRALADEGRGVMLITHDIDLAFEVADRIAVFYAGTTLEVAPVSDFQQGEHALRHPYSKALWRALPQNGFVPVPGSQPCARDLPRGCSFGPRCPYATEECSCDIELRYFRDAWVRCCHAT